MILKENIFFSKNVHSYRPSLFKQPLKKRQNKDINEKWQLNEGR